MNNLKAVLSLLKSDKSKDRQQGVTSLREVFARSSVIENLDENRDGRAWLVVFQALFTSVVNERSSVVKKGSTTTVAAAERRLKDAAAAVRWLTEKSVSRWNTKVAKPLVKHLLQTMVHNGNLFAPVALDYVKALRVICSYPPHLDHLMSEDSQWIKILSMVFNVVLEDSLRSDLEDKPEGMSEAEVSSVLSEGDGTPSRKRKKRNAHDRKTSRHSKPRTASPEQIECVAIVAIILRSSRICLVSPEHPLLCHAVLDRLRRFFILYPVETSAHLDAIYAVNAALDCVSLNARDQVIDFAKEVWDHLLVLWASKSRPMKENVLICLTILFPYVTHKDAGMDRADGIGKLLRLLQMDHESRWGFEALTLNSIRLEVSLDVNTEPFIARTFRRGHNFTSGQANAWALLELQADCMKEIYLFTESDHSSGSGFNRAHGKRAKLENPLKTLLHAIQDPRATGSAKVFYLQSLLFLIDCHWSMIHPEIQLEVVNTLLQVVSLDDATVQSWTFCCFAAITCADCSVDSASDYAIHWDGIWSHSMRRTNAPPVSRAACHAAHVLLLSEKLPTNRVLNEIEMMAQDIGVQGPAAPYDSVCAFLVRCINIARQDARLYRMHLDDKVLGWFIESWSALSGMTRSEGSATRTRLEQFTVQDILALLETTCGLGVGGHLLCPIPIPDHPTADMMQGRLYTLNIREFLLHSRFPEPRVLSEALTRSLTSGQKSMSQVSELVQPGPRERKASTFLLKSTEMTTTLWDKAAEATPRPPAEDLRRALDLAVLVISFESSLVLNGIRSNRKSLLAACKLVSLLATYLLHPAWSSEEMLLLVSAFSPLTLDTMEARTDRWEAFVAAGKSTGVRYPVTDERLASETALRVHRDSRVKMQSIIWQSADVQDSLSTVLDTLKCVLKSIARRRKQSAGVVPADDDRDDFGPIRTSTVLTSSAVAGNNDGDNRNIAEVVTSCFHLLALAPVLQSSNGESSRDKSLIDLVYECDNDKFPILLEPFLHHVQRLSIRIAVTDLDCLLARIEGPLMSYEHGRSYRTQTMAIRLLMATVHVWLQASIANSDTGSKIRLLVQWLGENLREGHLRSWRTRDSLARFLDNYIVLDPTQTYFTNSMNDEEFEHDALPDALLLRFLKDEDIRVRYTAALSCAHLFCTAYIQTDDPMEIYGRIREQLCTALDDYEHMLSRFLCLANILIVSSSVRRGPYWHLLETCLYTQAYVPHIENMLSIAAKRMGLRHFSELFEAYASQIAYSIRISQKDITRLPPHLLGYRTLRECADASFISFSPTNLLAESQNNDEVLFGEQAFKRHCKLIDKSPADGLLKCFPDIAGTQIVFSVDEIRTAFASMEQDSSLSSETNQGQIFDGLRSKFVNLGLSEDLSTMIEKHVDGIVVAILRTNGDLDFSRDGLIIKALEGLDRSERIVRAFRALMKFRGRGEFDIHPPNLPSMSISVVLSSLEWLATQTETAKSPATTYHVIHQLFAEVARCPLVNEQIRLLTSLSIWISLIHSQFKNSTLLRVLMCGSVSLLAQPDLSAIAQGMLDWAFLHIKETRSDIPHVVEVLVRVCTISRAYRSSEIESVRKAGTQIKDWIESQLVILSEVDNLRRRIATALAAWPDELSGRLSDFGAEFTCSDLSLVLDDPYLSSHKFKTARRLSALARSSEYDIEQFAKHDFWRLKESVPLSNMLNEEVDAFTSLLIHCSGHLRNHGIDHLYGRSVGIRHQKLTLQKDDKGRRMYNASVKRPIVMSLLDMLADQAADVVDVAYRTLRLLAGIEPLDSPEHGSWPVEYRGDIHFLNFCSVTENVQKHQDLQDLSQGHFLEAGEDHSSWISKITVFFGRVLTSQDHFYAHLNGVLSKNASFAEQMLPVLVHTLLKSDQAHILLSIRKALSDYFTRLLKYTELDVRCHRSVVNLVLHLRNYQPENVRDALAYNRWLDLDFMLLSRSAISCGAYTTALLFVELAADARPFQEEDEKLCEQILFDIYAHIDEPDGFYGIKTQDLQNFLLRRFHHERQWSKAFHFHGAGFEAVEKGSKGSGGVLESLHAFGFNKLAMSTFQNIAAEDSPLSQSSDFSYRLGWRTETWDLPDPTHHRSPGSSLYVALRAIHRGRDASVIDNLISKSITNELHRLCGLGNEDLAEIREVLQSLMCLAQVRQWRSKSIQECLESHTICTEDNIWEEFCHLQRGFSFQDLESIIATRMSLIRSARQRDQRDQIGMMHSELTQSLMQLELNCLVQLSQAAREADQSQIALNSIVRALELSEKPSFEVSQEFANVLWLQREQKFAVEYLKGERQRQRVDLAHRATNSGKVRDALALAKLGEWTAEACLEKPDFIHSQFFAPAIELLLGTDAEENGLDDVRAVVFHKCALFAEQQYHTIVKSPELVRLKVYSERKRQELKEREDTMRRSQHNNAKLAELTQHQRRAKALYEQDTAQYLEVSRARDTFLHQAIQMLSLCLEASDAYDGDAGIRLCSLWFANFSSDALNSVLPTAISKIPSRKFVFLAHQLSARLSSSESSKTSTNQRTLQSLLLRMCSEHPFHSLYQVYSIQSSVARAVASTTRRRSSAIEVESLSQVDRASAASDIFHRLQNIPEIVDKVRDVRELCNAYLEWAKFPIKNDARFTDKNKKKEPYEIPAHLAIARISNLKVPVTTAYTPLDPTMQYKDCVWIRGYDPEFETAGGINLPKISYCYGSDGLKYRQLFKGEGDDDLRQDAVMEQVFELCNQVLRRDRETKKRELSIRSYKVVPLAPQAGLLEFVGSTVPMQNWLSVAHARYRPMDQSVRECANQLSALGKETKRDKNALVKLFLEIRSKFKPVMRHFFTERHKAPQAWFEMRLNYSRSVAVSSIIGHVLGLGDRHISNILLDMGSGEVVHIDLGIAFEQGKLLPIAERVPFRLTADIVDGFGMSGTEGVFRRCAEETLRVLRDGSDVIKTVLEVFKYDPLHSWTASAVKIRKAQAESSHQLMDPERFGIGIDMESGMEDEAADRALNGVARKLDKSLSVEYTVNELIAEATDVANLAQMFAGWSPFC